MNLFFSSNRPIKPLSYWAYYAPTLLLALIGLSATLYLSAAHYRVYMDMGYKSFCAISRSINCDTVSQSSYAVFLGMPLAVWGVIGYLVVLGLLLTSLNASTRPRRLWSSIQIISFLFCVFDLYLAWISSYRIHSYCIICILTYAVNFGLLYYAWLTRRRFEKASLFKCLKKDGEYLWERRWITAPLLAGLATIMILGTIFYPGYWHYTLPRVNASVATGLTPDGRPWIGAQEPELIIEEYSDYLCFQCSKIHSFLRELVSQHPEKLRLVHYHFPMDKAYNPLVKKSFHDGAGQMALLALYAGMQGKFWQMNDLLFEGARERNPIGMRELAKALNLDFKEMARAIDNTELQKRLWLDIRSGLKHQISATPTFVVEGEVYQGTIPAMILQSVLD